MEKKNDLVEQFKAFTKSLDEAFQKRFGSGLSHSVDQFFHNFPFTSDIQVDWSETTKQYLLKVKVPGIPKEKIETNLLGNQLQITYTVNNEEEGEYRKVARSFKFSQPIDEEKIVATHQDGLLTIVVPKAEKKSIQIL